MQIKSDALFVYIYIYMDCFPFHLIIFYETSHK